MLEGCRSKVRIVSKGRGPEESDDEERGREIRTL